MMNVSAVFIKQYNAIRNGVRQSLVICLCMLMAGAVSANHQSIAESGQADRM